MKIIARLVWAFTLLIVRIPLALFINMLLPLAFFVFYAGMLLHASGPQAASLIVRLVTLGALSNGLLGLSVVLVILREQDILRRYHLAPISAFHIVIGRLVANYSLFLIVVLVELGLARVVFALDIAAVLPQLVLVFSLGYLATAGIGLIIAAIVDTVADAQACSQVAFFALLFLSGIAVPLAALPASMQYLAAFIPVSLTIVAANGVLNHVPLAMLWREALALTVIAAVAISVATVMFRWEKEAKMTGRDRVKAVAALIPLLVIGFWLNSSGGFMKRIAAGSDRVSSPPPSLQSLRSQR